MFLPYLVLLFVLNISKTLIWQEVLSLTPCLRSSALIPTWTNETVSMYEMAGTRPLHVFLTGCPLARCGARSVLPNPAYVTASHLHAPHAGTPLHPNPRDGKRWQAVGGPAVCVGNISD